MMESVTESYVFSYTAPRFVGDVGEDPKTLVESLRSHTVM